MRHAWRAAALGAAVLLIAGCGGRATLGGPGAGHGGRTADAASGQTDGARGRTDGGLADDAGQPPGLVVTVTAVSPSPELAESPAVGATVALDTPTGERLEATTNGDGQAVFPPLDWAAGTATVTAGLSGYGLRTIMGVAGDAPEVALMISSLAEPGALATVTGSAVAVPYGWPWNGSKLEVSATVPCLVDYDGLWGYSLETRRGAPFTLIAAAVNWENCWADSDCLRPFHSEWLAHEVPPLTDGTTIDLDFTGATVGRSTEGTLDLPPRPDSPLRGGTCTGRVSTLESKGYATIGVAGWTPLFPWASQQCDYTMSYVEISSVGTPVTQVGVWGHVAGSMVWATGYPHEAPPTIVLLDLPQWRSTPGQSLQSPLAWEHFDEGVVGRLSIQRADGKMVWHVDAPHDATSVTLPPPPSTSDTSALFGQEGLTAQVFLHRGEDEAVRYISFGYRLKVIP